MLIGRSGIESHRAILVDPGADGAADGFVTGGKTAFQAGCCEADEWWP